jgi:hypothetical protein
VFSTDTTAPSAVLASPGAGQTVAGIVTLAAEAADNVGVAAVAFLVNGLVVGSDTTAPYSASWDSRTVPDGAATLAVRAADAAGNVATSSAVVVTVQNAVPAEPQEVVLYAARTTPHGAWVIELDGTAAGGQRVRHPNTGAAKIPAALATPTHYFELTFPAAAGVPYHLWVRGKADADHWSNDAVYVQFSGSVTSSGAAVHRIGTTSAEIVVIEDCSGCGVSGWGWQDNGYGTLGPHVYFAQTGPQRLRFQTREDGLSIDQIILSPVRFLTARPGALRNDATIYPEGPPAP